MTYILLGFYKIIVAYAFEIRIRSLIMESMATRMTLVVEGMRGITTPKGLTYWRDDPLTSLVVGHLTEVICDSTSGSGSY